MAATSTVKDHVEFQFATTVRSLRQETEQVQVDLSDGTTALVDLLVGADGVHSYIRRLAFGEEKCFARFLGYFTAAFMLRLWYTSFGSAYSTIQTVKSWA